MGFGLWDIAQIVVPIAAGVVGTPAAGAGVAALMQGAETKAKGGSWLDAAKGAAIAGGTSALGAAGGEALGGMLSGAGGAAASEGAKAATKETFKSTLGKGIEGALTESAAGGAGKQAFSLGLKEGLSGGGSDSLVGNEIGKVLSREIAENAGDAAAKQRFSEHLLKFGKAGVEKYGEEKEENAELNALLQKANLQFMDNAKKNAGYTAPEPWHSPRRY